MMYQAFENYTVLTAPWRSGAAAALRYLNLLPQGTSDAFVRRLAAALELITRSRLTYERPPYDIKPVMVGNRACEVIEEVAYATPFGSLLHFRKDGAPEQPRVLLVAPMSGHFATLLRNTVQTLLQDHDVYITDWHNPRDIPVSAGDFALADYTEHLIAFLGQLGPRPHMVAICQPSVSALAAAALMSEDDHPSRPASLTLMAGPIDTRIQPTKVNEFAKSKPLSWFEQNMINLVPVQCAGAFRKVYPGFVQLTAFVSMNLERHVKSHLDLMTHLANGETEKAETIKTFYDEYFAVMDLPGDFYIETIRDVFQEHLLPQGKLMHRDRPVRPAAVSRMGLLTVEGEKDDICSIGQTVAAQDLCTGVRQYRKQHHMQAGVGHYGVFSGRRWNSEIYPLLRDFIHLNA
ncbi:polyhydroxyalkanoate depolymerase [Bradyrhizobium sp. U87765 SZCCT0131]|uniref:polyhydroxyalkanoate depolymerase n=1 Tax=unclassified Bradyrhizobium TaxID=2631580 RepID=UPI001BA43C1C|nr:MULTISPECIES: polyhydroxyalkanoate depolymerase [unclassified Bradyrhizobium]MBR1219957.1 polyhydroxyalkanoate depolymerase [Bradyrhizobium sp. U87765 SZCCT0131]MBR1263587.1 polyhydroxyalkanoate depolymerase [Bradyrhizobium sp. U87765 SZCCT0134]MBR1309156.1 polyhydroxyalkanoate depolymerase [Bradyrhizobium sp. U87765 SZCCT0110]MBR1323919.1 polyhydroxyalkanoate depolymerase [Bradyrhizobium sp. U87765 SZCCT0109]MBR1349471.1 polyhydroxyalkanoate depolymerase [Bradyrhizobium sp. U87765 SZCCT004